MTVSTEQGAFLSAICRDQMWVSALAQIFVCYKVESFLNSPSFIRLFVACQNDPSLSQLTAFIRHDT